MKEEEIKELFEQFEAIANEYEGVECWSARELASYRIFKIYLVNKI